LQMLPIDRLKIDRSFIQNLGMDRNGAAIVEAVAGIGRSLGLEVLAEGVETPAQLRQVTLAGCQFVQGFYFGRPMTADALPAYRPPSFDRPPALIA